MLRNIGTLATLASVAGFNMGLPLAGALSGIIGGACWVAVGYQIRETQLIGLNITLGLFNLYGVFSYA